MSNLSSPVAFANSTELTNSDVYVFARFDDNAAVNQYSFDGRKWEEYAAGMNGVALTENGVVHFRSLDAAGEVSPVTTFEVSNIDKIPPDVPVVSAEKADTFEGVLVSAAFSKDSVTQEYSFEGKKWIPYEGPITVTESSTVVLFRATDAAGNESYSEYKEENFPSGDDDGLNAPIARPSTTELTNSDVYVTAIFDSDAAVNQFSTDGQNWEEYADGINGIPFAENGTVSFRSLDAAGSVSPITTYNVTNIDKTPPDAPVISVQTADTFDGVFLSATFSKDSVVQEYSFEGKKWIPYEGAITVTESGTTVLFRATDAAGNESFAEYKGENFPTGGGDVGPAAPVARADITDPTNGAVRVYPTFDPDAAVNEVSLDGGQTWMATTGQYFVTFRLVGSVMSA